MNKDREKWKFWPQDPSLILRWKRENNISDERTALTPIIVRYPREVRIGVFKEPWHGKKETPCTRGKCFIDVSAVFIVKWLKLNEKLTFFYFMQVDKKLGLLLIRTYEAFNLRHLVGPLSNRSTSWPTDVSRQQTPIAQNFAEKNKTRKNKIAHDPMMSMLEDV